MDANVLMQAISTLGFPIVCCAALFWKMNKQDDQHKQEMDVMSKAIENNTLVLTEIQTLLRKEE